MKKILTILLLAGGATAMAQEQANQVEVAQQSTNLVMSNAIDIALVNAGDVTLRFENVNDYASGVESEVYQVLVRSNKKFRVQTKTSASRFTYSGSTTPAPQMNVSNVLFLKVVANNTGGSVSSSFNNKYRSMSSSSQTLISNATPGGNNTFDVKYKAAPGFSYPAGTYAVNVVYTATQM